MKQSIRTRFWLMIFSVVLISVLCMAMPSHKAFAGTVRISESSLNLFTKGGRKNIYLYVTDDNRLVTALWKSSNKKVATVNSNGFVNAKRTGWTTIMALYGGTVYSCRVHVRKTSATYKKCIKAYNKFLMNPYVTYTDSGNYDQADEFNSIDLDRDGIPELLVNVYDANRRQYYVLYHYKDNKISFGQRLGQCGNFIWYSPKSVLSYSKYESGRTLTVYAIDNGISLNSKAIEAAYSDDGSHYYYKSRDDGKNPFQTEVSAIKFREYVDHDLLGFCTSKPLTMHVNTPSNRSRYLK